MMPADHVDFDDIRRAFGDKSRLLDYAASIGLKVARGKLRCPVCRGGSGEKTDAGVFARDGTTLWKCHRCDTAGSVIELARHALALPGEVEAARAVADWLGHAPPPPKRTPRPPKDVGAIWTSIADHAPDTDAYVLERLRWMPPPETFGANAPGVAADPWLQLRAKEGYHLAAPLYGPGGALLSLQVRATVPGLDPAKLSLAGVPHKGGAFGDADRSRTAHRIVLGEGLMDRLALACLGEVVMTAPGTGGVADLREHVGDPAGREIVLCPQNDVDGQSESAFAPLEREFRAAGAVVRVWRPPEGTKDCADWLRDIGPEAFRSSFQQLLTVVPLPRPSDAGGAVRAEMGELREMTRSFATICHILRTPELRSKVLGEGELEFNEQRLEPCIGRRPIPEHAAFALRERCERTFCDGHLEPLRFCQGDVDKALLVVAHEHPFHPVADYLRGLAWDGVPRIACVADEILRINTESADEKALAGVILRCWFVSAVRRALMPGCKVDDALILIGPQGARKSTFFKVLASEDWFADTIIDLHDKDGKMLLRRVWMLEWAELETLQRARSVPAVKAFLSSAVDHVRPPYARTVAEYPRTCIIVGSTNEMRFLADDTGNRRYWTLAVGPDIDTDTLAAWRDQLWAEARVAADSGEPHYLPRDGLAALRAVQERFETNDAWEERVFEFADKQKSAAIEHPITTATVLEHAIGKPPGQWTRGDEMRIAAIFRRRGWSQAGRPRAQDGKRLRLWIPPEIPAVMQPLDPACPPVLAVPIRAESVPMGAGP